MKIPTLYFAIGLLSVAAPAPAVDTPRLWTDNQGRKLEAVFLMTEGGIVYLQLGNGVVHALPLAVLSASDQEFARRMAPSEHAAALTAVPTNASAAQAAAKIDELVLRGLRRNASRSKPALAGKAVFNPPLSDEQFVRRAYLDIAGRIPNHEETTKFLSQAGSDKRMKLIDALLESDAHVSHMYNYFAEMLRIVDGYGLYVRGLGYIQWVKDQVRANRPWDQMVYDMITAEGKVWNNGPAGYLLRDSGMPLDNLANTLQVFLGTDVSCAQCHDHPFADWTQRQFYEMAAFFGATSTMIGGRDFPGSRREELVQGAIKILDDRGKNGQSYFAQINNIVGANVYSINDLNENRMQLPHDYKYKDGRPREPVTPKLIAWEVSDRKSAAYKIVDALPKDSVEGLRRSFGGWMTHPQNPRFAMTIANRMWQRAFGLPLTLSVHNLDHPEEAYNPELLRHLASEMVRVKFNLREFMRILYNTRAYQSQATTSMLAMGDPYYFQGPVLRRMSAEQAWDSFMTLVLGEPEKFKTTEADLYGRSIEMNLLNPKLDSLTVLNKVVAINNVGAKERAKASGGLDMGGAEMSPKMGRTEGKGDAGDTMMEGSGGYLTHEGMKLLRAAELPQPAPAGHFLLQFGQSNRTVVDGGSTDGTVPQVLMMMNGRAQEMITNTDSLIFRTMARVASPPDKVEAVFLSILNRRPTLQEKDISRQAIAAHGDEAYADIIWSLINTREFYFLQ